MRAWRSVLIVAVATFAAMLLAGRFVGGDSWSEAIESAVGFGLLMAFFGWLTQRYQQPARR